MSVSNSGLPIQELNCFVDLSLFQVANKHGRIHPLTDINSKAKAEDSVMIANLRELCCCFPEDDCNPQTSQQELFWQREQAVHTLSAFLVHGLDKKKP